MEFFRLTTNLLPASLRWLVLVLLCGCGTTQSQTATQQLLLSDAVDRSVASIDFSPLSGKKIYLEDKYLQSWKTPPVGFVNADYILSALRQQLFAANCELQEKPDTAELILEPRVGALGSDAHDITYGLPPNNTLNSAVSAVPNAPNMPMLPELAFAKRNDQLGAAKVALFAYARESRDPVWQSGTSLAVSKAKNVWVLGVGPFQSGTIYDSGPRFAGTRLGLPLVRKKEEVQREQRLSAYDQQQLFDPEAIDDALQPAGDDVQLSSFIEATAEPSPESANAAGSTNPAAPADPAAAGTPQAAPPAAGSN